MKNTAWFGVLAVLGAAAITACGNSSSSTGAGGGTGTGGTGTGGTGTGGTTASTTASSSSSSSTSSTTSSTSSSSSSSTSSTSSGGSSINNCTEATAEDHTADTSTTIAFGGSIGLAYSPPCIKIAHGSTVTFNGAFASHPLSGGIGGTKDATSPITETNTGTTATFTFPTAGTYGFFCEFHVTSAGMEGAIFVQ